MILGWTGDNGDPDNFLDVLLGCDAVGGNNRAQWCNEEFDKLVSDAKVTADQAERTKLYEEAQVVFKREAPWATLDHSLVVMPMSKKVSGYRAWTRSASIASTASTSPSKSHVIDRRSVPQAGRSTSWRPPAGGSPADREGQACCDSSSDACSS